MHPSLTAQEAGEGKMLIEIVHRGL